MHKSARSCAIVLYFTGSQCGPRRSSQSILATAANSSARSPATAFTTCSISRVNRSKLCRVCMVQKLLCAHKSFWTIQTRQSFDRLTRLIEHVVNAVAGDRALEFAAVAKIDCDD